MGFRRLTTWRSGPWARARRTGRCPRARGQLVGDRRRRQPALVAALDQARSLRDEAISKPAFGAYVARVRRVVAELVAQSSDVHADVVDLVDVLPTPHPCQQGPVLQNVAGVAHEVVQELVLGRRQIQSLTAQSSFVARKVDLELSGAE